MTIRMMEATGSGKTTGWQADNNRTAAMERAAAMVGWTIGGSNKRAKKSCRQNRREGINRKSGQEGNNQDGSKGRLDNRRQQSDGRLQEWGKIKFPY